MRVRRFMLALFVVAVGTTNCVENSADQSAEINDPQSPLVIAFDIVNDYSEYTVINSQTYYTPDRSSPLASIVEVEIVNLESGIRKTYEFADSPIDPGRTEGMCCFPEGFYDITVIADSGYQKQWTNYAATLRVNSRTGKPTRSLEVMTISVAGWNLPKPESSTDTE